MTTFLLCRHAAHLLGGGTIAGRTPGVHLSPDGHAQAARLADRLAPLPIRAVYCSPVERARETAQPLADRLGLPIHLRDSLSEIDFGEWSGRKLDDLGPLPDWQQWNAFRSGARIPAGERMLQTQSRIVTEMLQLRETHPDQVIAVVSHGDVIKSAVAYWAGVPLDLFQRIEISLASVTAIALADHGPWILTINRTADLPLPS